MTIHEDVPLQEKLIKIGRSAIISAHADLLAWRNDPTWEHTTASDYVQKGVKKRIGHRVSDSTHDDNVAELAVKDELTNKGREEGIHVLTYEQLFQPQSLSLKADERVMAVISEEYMKPENNTGWKSINALNPACEIIALVDALDGTMLRQRDLPNWCIAIVFYTRTEGEVLASLVGQAIGDLYYATRSGGAFRESCDFKNPRKDGRLVLGSLKQIKVQSLTPERHLAFVAQKPKSFIKMASLVDMLNGFDRVYNLGGNPMLAKLADGSMSAVFEPSGHKAHDVVPGAFIAKMAGAAVYDLQGGELDWRYALRNPDHKDKAGLLSYAAATNHELAQQILKALPVAER
jgi:fructose-1,6-bisphosphatase/inositol monophosphatase family enzyme